MSNSLAEVHPELVSEWSEKNLPLTPDDITFGSNKKVWWKGACGHEWQASVKARSNGEKCPICSGARVIAGINDLATLEPLLVKQWSKKNKIKPTEVSIGSHKKVFWRSQEQRTLLKFSVSLKDLNLAKWIRLRLSVKQRKLSQTVKRLKKKSRLNPRVKSLWKKRSEIQCRKRSEQTQTPQSPKQTKALCQGKTQSR